jgi:hypothetical protein
MKIENVEIPLIKFCPVEILLSQTISGVKKYY